MSVLRYICVTTLQNDLEACIKAIFLFNDNTAFYEPHLSLFFNFWALALYRCMATMSLIVMFLGSLWTLYTLFRNALRHSAETADLLTFDCFMNRCLLFHWFPFTFGVLDRM